ncbi:MAG TPA: hypothetical protein VJT79_06715 [Pseudonocardia sp.]|nr:hypothetical protein [Pseudonocardia sp.]
MTELRRALRRIWVDGRRVERVAYVVGLVLFVSGLVHVGILLVTGWTWIGPVSLRKAATFGLSFGLTLPSVAWATSYLRLPARGLVLGVFIATCVVETVLISMQAWRGVPSHFNFATPFDTAVSTTLALGGGVIVLVGVVCTLAAFAGAGGLAPSMALAVRTGLVVLLVAFATGAVMVARGVVEARGGQAQLAYDTAGSLKPLHAVAMHVVLVLPALAWLLAHTSWAEARRLRLVWVAVVADAVLTAVVGYEAFAGIPPLTPPLVLGALSVAALIVLATTGATALRAVLAPA